MAEKTVKAVATDKVKMFSEYDDVMKRLIAESKREVAELQHTRETLLIKKTQLEDEIKRQQSQFEQWKRLEEDKMQQAKFKFNNEIIAKEKASEIGELDLKRRSEEIQRREAVGIKIMEKETKLNNDRLEIESLRSQASHLMEEAQRKMSDASSMFSNANQMEAKAKETLNKANVLNDSIVKRENIIAEKEKDMELKTKNLEELQRIVDPKMVELKAIQEKIDIQEKDLVRRESSVEGKMNEERIILKDLEAKEKKLREREKQLDQKEEEILRKALLAGIK